MSTTSTAIFTVVSCKSSQCISIAVSVATGQGKHAGNPYVGHQNFICAICNPFYMIQRAQNYKENLRMYGRIQVCCWQES